MYSNVSITTLLLTFIMFHCGISSVQAANKEALSAKITFSVQPQQCVTLRQGRDCFTTVTIQWQKNTEQALCLYEMNTKQSDSQKQLMCWQKSSKGQTSVDFESSDNLTYQLRTLEDEHLIAEAEVVVSWVHKKTTRRRRWRLF